MKGVSIAATSPGRIIGLILFSAFSSLAVFAITFHNGVLISAKPEPPCVRLREFTLTFYRAPEHSYPPENMLDPYDSFKKDANGDLIISATGTNRYSGYARSLYLGYALKTHKGNEVIVYQETPSRRGRDKSNCHGLTFLDGDYWLLGSQVERILADNDWVAISPASAQRGDVAVYRDLKGRIVHTARVVGRDNDRHVLVNSKNGFESEMEAVHAARVVPPLTD
jgi:hypothetical protein